jgi:hypothetical protein
MTSMQSVSVGDMVAQSQAIISNPSVSTFERYERRGSITHAAVYIAIAAVIVGLLGLTGGLGGLVSGVLGTVAGFFIFTGMVYLLGKNIAGGTGNFDEVAYTFSLFSAPIYVIGAVVGLIVWLFSFIPVLGFLVGILGFLVSLLILVVQAYFAYIAVQSSMNIHDSTKAIITLVLAVVASMVVQLVLGSIFFFL